MPCGDAYPTGGCWTALPILASGRCSIHRRNYWSPISSIFPKISMARWSKCNSSLFCVPRPSSRRWTNSSLRSTAIAKMHAKSLQQRPARSEEHTSELQSLMRISYAVFCLKKKTIQVHHDQPKHQHHDITHQTITRQQQHHYIHK